MGYYSVRIRTVLRAAYVLYREAPSPVDNPFDGDLLEGFRGTRPSTPNLQVLRSAQHSMCSVVTGSPGHPKTIPHFWDEYKWMLGSSHRA